MDDRRKNYRRWDAQQGSQEAVSPQEALPEDDLVFFLLDTIPQLNLMTAGVTVLVATWRGFPVSPTHALTGALLGAGLAYIGIAGAHSAPF